MKRLAAIIACTTGAHEAVLFRSCRPEPPAAQFKIKVAVDLVNVNFSATDQRPLGSRTLPRRTSPSKKMAREQNVTLFAREQELPLTLALLIDTSPSVDRSSLKKNERPSLSGIRSGTRDLALVIAFDRCGHSGTGLHRGPAQPDEGNSESDDLRRRNVALRRRISGSRGEAVPEAGRKGDRPDLRRRRHHQQVQREQSHDRRAQSNAVIYSISNGRQIPERLRRICLKKPAAHSSHSGTGDFEKIFDQIALELRTQYSLAYHSTNTASDGNSAGSRSFPKTRTSVFAREGILCAQRYRQAARRFAFLLLFLLVLTGSSAQEVQIRSRVELVVVPVYGQRSRTGQLATGLTQDDFTITEAGKKQTITSFSIDPVPISAAVLIDTGHFGNCADPASRIRFPALIGGFSDDDEIAVYRFDKYVEKLDGLQQRSRSRSTRAFEEARRTSTLHHPRWSAGRSQSGPRDQRSARYSRCPKPRRRTIALTDQGASRRDFQAAEDLSTRAVDRRRILFVASRRTATTTASFLRCRARSLLTRRSGLRHSESIHRVFRESALPWAPMQEQRRRCVLFRLPERAGILLPA